MTAKEYLTEVQRIDADIQMLNAEIDKIRLEMSGLIDDTISSSWPDGQPHGTGTGDPVGEKAARHADRMRTKAKELRMQLMSLETKLARIRSDRWTLRMHIIEDISKVPDPVHRRILSLHYLEGRSWEWIAVEIGYSYRHTTRLHGEALQAMDKILATK